MSTDHRFDQTAARQFEMIYSVPKVIARRQKTLAMLDLKPGEHVLDIGSGPGYFAREIAEKVGIAGNVWGIDNSESMLAIAGNTCAECPQVTLQVGDAAKLPLPDSSVDAVVIVQTYAYVSDISSALNELKRVLKPNGRAVIADIDWDSLVWHTSNPVQMTRFRSVLDEHFAHPQLPRHFAPLLKDAGLSLKSLDSIVMLNTQIDPYTFGLSKLIGRFITGRHGITAEEVADWEADLAKLSQDGKYFFSANQYLFLVEK